MVTKQLDELRKEVLNLKEGLKPPGPPKQHGGAKSLSPEAPSAKDVQWLSDGYDEIHSANGRAEESLNSIEYRLQQMADKVFQITKEVDETALELPVQCTGVPQAEGTSKSAEDTVKKCLDIFSGIGANEKSK